MRSDGTSRGRLPRSVAPLVLNVDDTAANRYFRRSVLENVGIEVIDAETGEEALAHLAAQPDIVLLDIRLPDTSGFELCRQIKLDPYWRQTYVLLISAEFRSDADWARGLEFGADGFLRTPVEPAVLANTVHALLRRQASERRTRAERIDGEAAVRRFEQLWRGLFEHAPFGIVHATPEGRIRTANAALARLLRAPSREALVGASVREFFDESGLTWTELLPRWSSTEPAPPFEATWRTLSGQTAFVMLQGRRLEGPEPGFEIFATDLSEQRRLEQEFRQSQKMEAVGRLAGGIAHDFNNLLTAILGYSELALDNTPHDNPLAEDLREIRQSAQRAAALTQQLLAFSRRQVLTLQPVNMNVVVEGMQHMLRRIIGEDIRIDWTSAVELPTIKADTAQLEQVLLNLAVNARDAMPQGGRLTVRTSVETLDDSSLPGVPVVPGRFVRLDVVDTGEGMDPATQVRIFEPFFTTKLQGKGTGLGLSTVYGIVKQLSGYIVVRSTPGDGTAFSLFFPVSGIDEPRAPVEHAAAMEHGHGGECVLLVEDEDVLRRLTRAVLERQGYRVLDAAGPTEAIRTAAQHTGKVDLILTDVMMPEMRGWEMVARLRESRPDARVLYMSGYVDEVETAGEKVRPLLPKPFKPRELLDHIRRVLDN